LFKKLNRKNKMVSLIVFSLATLLGIYTTAPSNKTKIWLSTVFTPLYTLIVDTMICIAQYSYYYAGTQVAKSFLFAIISGFVIYFSLKGKFEKAKNQTNTQEEENAGRITDAPDNEVEQYEKIIIDGKKWTVYEPGEKSIDMVDGEGGHLSMRREEYLARRNSQAFMDSLPKNEKGEIDYGQISDPKIYLKAMKLEFGEYAAVILDEVIKDTNIQLEVVSKSSDTVEKVIATKHIQDKLNLLNEVKQQMDKVAPSRRINALNEQNRKVCLKQQNDESTKGNKRIKIFVVFTGILIALFICMVLYVAINIDNTKHKNGEIAIKDTATIRFNYEGLSFSYYKDWTIEKNVIYKDFAFQVGCTKGLFLPVSIIISWTRMPDVTPSEMIEPYIEGLRETDIYKNAKLSAPYNGTFKGQNSVSVDFVTQVIETTVYGTITTFAMNGNIVSIMKQCYSKEKLSTEFKIVEESINIKTP
jgi:membrane protein implicated in regulation of membrane protease activity